MAKQKGVGFEVSTSGCNFDNDDKIVNVIKKITRAKTPYDSGCDLGKRPRRDLQFDIKPVTAAQFQKIRSALKKLKLRGFKIRRMPLLPPAPKKRK